MIVRSKKVLVDKLSALIQKKKDLNIAINSQTESLEQTTRLIDKLKQLIESSSKDFESRLNDMNLFKKMTGFTSLVDYEKFYNLLSASSSMCQGLLKVTENCLQFLSKVVTQIDDLSFILSGTRNCSSTSADLVGEMVTLYKSTYPLPEEIRYPVENIPCLKLICEKENKKLYDTIPDEIWNEIFSDMEAVEKIFTSNNIDDWLDDKLKEKKEEEKTHIEELRKEIEELKNDYTSQITDLKADMKSMTKEEKEECNKEIKQLEMEKKEKLDALNNAITKRRNDCVDFSRAVKLLRGCFLPMRQQILSPIQRKAAADFFKTTAPGFLPIYVQYNTDILLLTN